MKATQLSTVFNLIVPSLFCDYSTAGSTTVRKRVSPSFRTELKNPFEFGRTMNSLPSHGAAHDTREMFGVLGGAEYGCMSMSSSMSMSIYMSMSMCMSMDYFGPHLYPNNIPALPHSSYQSGPPEDLNKWASVFSPQNEMSGNEPRSYEHTCSNAHSSSNTHHSVFVSYEFGVEADALETIKRIEKEFHPRVLESIASGLLECFGVESKMRKLSLKFGTSVEKVGLLKKEASFCHAETHSHSCINMMGAIELSYESNHPQKAATYIYNTVEKIIIEDILALKGVTGVTRVDLKKISLDIPESVVKNIQKSTTIGTSESSSSGVLARIAACIGGVATLIILGVSVSKNRRCNKNVLQIDSEERLKVKVCFDEETIASSEYELSDVQLL